MKVNYYLLFIFYKSIYFIAEINMKKLEELFEKVTNDIIQLLIYFGINEHKAKLSANDPSILN